jgi:hypothetical protein
MQNTNSNNYYVIRKNKLLKNFANLMTYTKKIMLAKYNKNFVDLAITNMHQEYAELIPQIPYIGGNSNSQLTQSLIFATEFLAIFKVLKRSGNSVEEIGNIALAAVELQLQSLGMWSKLKLFLSWRMIFSKNVKQFMQKDALKTHQREYPNGFVYDYIEGDGKEFDFGWDFSECAICKFFHTQNAEEFTPYVCKADFIESKIVNSGLVRTTTLATGGSKCDFRFKNGRKIAP